MKSYETTYGKIEIKSVEMGPYTTPPDGDDIDAQLEYEHEQAINERSMANNFDGTQIDRNNAHCIGRLVRPDGSTALWYWAYNIQECLKGILTCKAEDEAEKLAHERGQR